MIGKSPTPPKSLRCAVYARVSSDKQDVENSLDRQLRACRAWAEHGGHFIPDALVFVDEAKSGASMLARPAFQRLLDAVRGRGPVPFDAVLVDDDSRLDRGGKLAQVAEVFQARGVRLISVDSGRDLTSEDERLLVHVKSGLNEHYLHELARRTRNGLASKVLHGFHAGGKVYGYRLVPIWPEGLPPERRDRESRIGTKVEVNPVEAAIVRRVFEGFARGIGRREIAHTLNREGVRSSRGLPSWDPSALRVMLLNRKYLGDWSWNRIRWQKVPEAILTETERERARRTGHHPRRPVARPAEDLVPFVSEDLRIISDDLWRQVEARFAAAARSSCKGRDARRTRSVIAGLLTCACGSPLTTVTNTRKGYTYSRVGCAWHKNRGETVCGNALWMRADVISEPLLALVRDEILKPERIAQALAQLRAKVAARCRSEKADARATALRAEQARLEREIENLVTSMAAAPASAALAGALGTRETRLAQVGAEIEALTTPGPVTVPDVDEDQIRARVAELHRDLKRLDSDRARAALGRILGPVTVQPLDGSWAAGWDLKVETRPWGLIPKVASMCGCGGRI